MISYYKLWYTTFPIKAIVSESLVREMFNSNRNENDKNTAVNLQICFHTAKSTFPFSEVFFILSNILCVIIRMRQSTYYISILISPNLSVWFVRLIQLYNIKLDNIVK